MLCTADYKGVEALKSCHTEFVHIHSAAFLFSLINSLTFLFIFFKRCTQDAASLAYSGAACPAVAERSTIMRPDSFPLRTQGCRRGVWRGHCKTKLLRHEYEKRRHAERRVIFSSARLYFSQFRPLLPYSMKNFFLPTSLRKIIELFFSEQDM